MATILGVRPAGQDEIVELAGGIHREVERGSSMIMWLGQHRRVRAPIAPAEPEHQVVRDGVPVELIGAALFSPHLVLLDYGARVIEIEAQS